MTTMEDFRRFISEFPRHRYQAGALAAFEAALQEVTPDDLQHAVRLFGREVRAAQRGPVWKYCPGPTRWLHERQYSKYLTQQEEQ